MPRPSEAEDLRVTKTVAILREEVARSNDLGAEGNEGEFTRIGGEGVALLRRG